MPRAPDNDGSSSICTKPGFQPIRYHWYSRQPGEKFIHALRALVAEIDVPERVRSQLIGEMGARMKKLAEGKLVPVRHVVGPLDSVTDLHLFEIKAGVDYTLSDTAQVRAYHVEPRQLRSRRNGSTIVGLHMHHKVTDENAPVNELQDVEIQRARDRFFDGRESWWGGCALPNA